jgi:hypothetical protein
LKIKCTILPEMGMMHEYAQMPWLGVRWKAKAGP